MTDTTALAQAADAAVDEAMALVAGVDTSTLPSNVGQALGLLTAADSALDELLEALGVYDPDEDADDSGEDIALNAPLVYPAAGPVLSGQTNSTAPRDNLLRAIPGGFDLRTDDAGTTLYGHFSRFDSWYEIDSAYEGRFLERVAPGSFDATFMADRSSMKVLYDHGFDPTVGNKPLGPIAELRSDEAGAYYEVPLYDTDYNREQILPLLRGQLMDGRQVGSALGASFRFQVTDEDWNTAPLRSDHNPERLPERTITGAKVFEFGPVTFPASPAATAGVRSLTDDFNDRLAHDPIFVSRFTERVGPSVVERMLRALPADRRSDDEVPSAATNADVAPDGPRVRSKSQREALVWAALHPRKD